MDIKELVRTGMFSVGYLMCHTKKSRVVYYHDVHVGDSCRLLLNCLNCI